MLPPLLLIEYFLPQGNQRGGASRHHLQLQLICHPELLQKSLLISHLQVLRGEPENYLPIHWRKIPPGYLLGVTLLLTLKQNSLFLRLKLSSATLKGQDLFLQWYISALQQIQEIQESLFLIWQVILSQILPSLPPSQQNRTSRDNQFDPRYMGAALQKFWQKSESVPEWSGCLKILYGKLPYMLCRLRPSR